MGTLAQFLPYLGGLWLLGYTAPSPVAGATLGLGSAYVAGTLWPTDAPRYLIPETPYGAALIAGRRTANLQALADFLDRELAELPPEHQKKFLKRMEKMTA